MDSFHARDYRGGSVKKGSKVAFQFQSKEVPRFKGLELKSQDYMVSATISKLKLAYEYLELFTVIQIRFMIDWIRI